MDPLFPINKDVMEGYYLYCVVETAKQFLQGFLETGVEIIPFQSFTFLVRPVDSLISFDDKQKVEDLVRDHQLVSEAALKSNLPVVPFAVGNIIRGGKSELKTWMKKNYNRLLKNMEKIRDRAEYNVKIFWNPSEYIVQLSKTNMELKLLKEKCQDKQSGAAYLYEQRVKKALEGELENQAVLLFQKFYAKIRNCVTEFVIDKIKKEEGKKQMLLHVSCLVNKDHESILGDILDEIEREGYPVCFTGPWPAYSFVN